jgi:hypothetical protein
MSDDQVPWWREDYVDPLPDPKTLTLGNAVWLVGEIIRIQVEMERSPTATAATKINHLPPDIALSRRYDVLIQSPGFPGFEAYAKIELGGLTLEAAYEFRRRVARLPEVPYESVDQLPLQEAVRLIKLAGPPTVDRPHDLPALPPSMPEAAAQPAEPPARHTEGNAGAYVPRLTREQRRALLQERSDQFHRAIENYLIELTERSLLGNPPADAASPPAPIARVFFSSDISDIPPADPTEEDRTRPPAAVDASGDKAQNGQPARPARKVARGRLDEQAAIEVKKNPSLTYEQLANILGCNAGTLRDAKRYPLLAAAKKMVQADRERYRRGDTWEDRQADDD